MTVTGLRPLRSVEIKAGGGKTPGMFVPVVGGAVAGRAGTSAAISGGLNVAQEKRARASAISRILVIWHCLSGRVPTNTFFHPSADRTSNGFPQFEHGRILNKSCPRFQPTIFGTREETKSK